MAKIEGSCLCGAVRYESDAEPAMVVNCYCRTCQKNSGSTNSYNYAVPEGTVRITGDTVKIYEDHSGASGKPFYRKFCSTCGSHFISSGPAYEGLEFIKAGTVDGDHPAPGTHIWTDEKMGWQSLPEGAQAFPRSPG